MCERILGGVQKLYDRWKNRVDRVVLTISQDENPAIAESVMEENGYSFPVICSAGLADKFVPGGGYPLEVLIDPKGRRIQRHPPRASDETIGKIEEIADEIIVIQ